MTPSNSYQNLSQLAQKQSYSHVELKPINLEFEHNGKTYSITFVKQKVGGEKGEGKNLDLTNLKPNDKLTLVAEAKKAMDMMGKLDGAATLKNSKSFTFHFTTQIKEPSFLNNKLGHRIKRFEYKPNPYELDSITYKEGSEDKKFAVNLSKYGKDDQKKIQENLQPLNKMIEKLFSESAKAEKPLKLGEDKPETPNVNNGNISKPEQQEEDLSGLDPVESLSEYRSYNESDSDYETAEDTETSEDPSL